MGLADAGAAVLGDPAARDADRADLQGHHRRCSSRASSSRTSTASSTRAPAATSDGTERQPAELAPFGELVVEDVHFAYPAQRATRRCAASRCGSAPARWSRSSARTARARRRSRSCSARCSRRPTGRDPLGRHRRPRRSTARALRRQIGVIFQDFVRYQLTARENIGFGRAEAVDDADGDRRRRRGRPAPTRSSSACPTGYETVARQGVHRRLRPVARASGSGSRSRARSSARRVCSCSTSRPHRSTRAPSTSCSSTSRRWRTAARCC